MKLDWSLSNVPKDKRPALKQKLKAALKKLYPQYWELFQQIEGSIKIENRVGGDEATLGQSRYYNQCIALKTELIEKGDEWNLVRVLSEEIIHYLDRHLGFSANAQVDAQKAADHDVSNPLSLAMILLVRAGGKDKTINDLFHSEHKPSFFYMFNTFSKSMPFLGVYKSNHGVDKYEWLTEVDHANAAIEDIKTIEEAQSVSVNTQHLLPHMLLLRYLSENDLDLFSEMEKIIKREKTATPDELKRARELIVEQIDSAAPGFNPWLNQTLLKHINEKHLDIENFESALDRFRAIKAGEKSDDNSDYLSIFNAALAKALLLDLPWKGRNTADDIKKMMRIAFPETQVVLESFRERVNAELEIIKAKKMVSEALASTDSIDATLREGVTETQLASMASALKMNSPSSPNTAGHTLRIYHVITGMADGGGGLVGQLLRDGAVPDAKIDGKTLMGHAIATESYEIATVLKNAIKTRGEPRAAPPLPPPN